MLWGFSPSFDFIQLLKDVKPENPPEGEINILLVGASDARHILTTMAKAYEHNRTALSVNFYVTEALLEVIAREMLLLIIALEPNSRLSLKEKVRIWMEVYGNTLLRPSSSKYVVEKSAQLIQMLSSRAYLGEQMPCIQMDELKYKDRDNLETIFQFWKTSDFNVSHSWDQILRRQLRERFDTRQGVFDWDYHMNLRSKLPESPVNEREYKQWRNNGVAFTWLETEYYVPNRTFALGIHSINASRISLGYLGDTVLGPYYSLVAERPKDDVERAPMSTPKYRVTDLIEKELKTIFFEIENQQPCPPELAKNEPLGLIMTGIHSLKQEMTSLEQPSVLPVESYSPIRVEHKVWFLSTNALETCPKKEKFRGKFDAAFVAAGFVEKLDDGFFSLLKDDSPVVLETWKAAFNVPKKQPKDFEMETRSCVEKFDFCQRYDDFSNGGFSVTYMKRSNSEMRDFSPNIYDFTDTDDFRMTEKGGPRQEIDDFSREIKGSGCGYFSREMTI